MENTYYVVIIKTEIKGHKNTSRWYVTQDYFKAKDECIRILKCPLVIDSYIIIEAR